jgi:hypothetical protein
MSKKGLNITISVILLFVFLISASAHSGRTDANGGHWNRSTGEYHYHTGEYAGRSQSSSSKSNGTRASQELIDIINKHEAQKKNQESQKRIPPPKHQPSKKDKTSFWDVVGIIIGLHIGFFPFVVAIYGGIFSLIADSIKKHKKKQNRM